MTLQIAATHARLSRGISMSAADSVRDSDKADVAFLRVRIEEER